MESTLDCAIVLGSLGFLCLKLKEDAELSNFLRECLRLHGEFGEDRVWMQRAMSSLRPMSSFHIKIALSLD
jgi:hypothetical protein